MNSKTNIDKIDHIAITVDDIQKSIDWYSKHFKFAIDYQDDSWALLKFDNINLALVLPNQHPSHLCFLKPNASDYGKLKTHRDGTKSVYIKDCNDNYIEIMETPFNE